MMAVHYTWILLSLLYLKTQGGMYKCVINRTPWDYKCNTNCFKTELRLDSCLQPTLPTKSTPGGGHDELIVVFNLGSNIMNISSHAFNGMRMNVLALYDTFRVFENEAFANLKVDLIIIGRNYPTSPLPARLFQGVINLKGLMIANNSLHALPAGLFKGLSELFGLDLENNKLQELPAGIFSDLGSLEGLQLKRNKLKTLPAKIFDNLQSLRWLNMDDNSFSCLAYDLFQPLHALEELNITQNVNIDGLCAKIFSGLDMKLKYSGPIDECVLKCSQGINEISGSSLNIINRDATCDCNSWKSCLNANCSELPPFWSIWDIKCEKKKKKNFLLFDYYCSNPKTVSGHAFNGMKMNTLYLQNTLRRLEDESFANLTVDKIEFRSIVFRFLLPSRPFQGVKNLKEIGFIGNVFIKSFPSGLFQGLTNLTRINLNDNRLYITRDFDLRPRPLELKLHAALFKGLSNLAELNLRKNTLQELDTELFKGLSNLSVLNLGNNNLQELHAELFKGLSNLAGLYLEHNNLQELHADLFKGLPNLVLLKVNNNNLQELHAELFKGLSNLAVLDLRSNSLQELDTELFKELSNLTVLNLGFNNLRELHADVFKGLSKLIVLGFRKNNLHKLPAGIFRDVGRLEKLYLGDNKLKTLPAKIFDNLQNLKELYMDGNSFSCLAYDLFQPLHALEMLNITQDVNIDGLCAQIFSSLEIKLIYSGPIDECVLRCSPGIHERSGSSLNIINLNATCDCNSMEFCRYANCSELPFTPVTVTPEMVTMDEQSPDLVTGESAETTVTPELVTINEQSTDLVTREPANITVTPELVTMDEQSPDLVTGEPVDIANQTMTTNITST